MKKILSVKEIKKSFASLEILKGINFDVNEGETLAITGPSGSGKSTLLTLCAGLDSPSSGHVFIDEEDLSPLNENQRSAVRLKKLGFIFQAFQLLPTLTALENVMLPLELAGQKPKQVMKDALELLEMVGLKDRVKHYPNQLSGGEQQRVAIARAFINKPKLLFADEPTGNLDDETSLIIEELLFDLNKKLGTTLLIVTHDVELAEKADRQLHLKNGHLVHDSHWEK